MQSKKENEVNEHHERLVALVDADILREQRDRYRGALEVIAFSETLQSDFKNWQRTKKIAQDALAD